MIWEYTESVSYTHLDVYKRQVFIGGANLIFGNENSSVAVVVFCILLMVRFVDFGYEIKSSLFSLFLVFFILTVGPILANSANPYWKLLIHMISISLLMVLTCLRPSYGNPVSYTHLDVYKRQW